MYFRVAAAVLAVGALSAPPPALAARSDTAPPLPAPGGTVVNVSTEAQLQQAVGTLRPNTTIVLAPGTYTLTSTIWINGTFSSIGIRGATNNPADVVIVGRGMTNASYGNVPHGIWSGGAVQGITIANLTLRDFYYHPIMFNAGTESPLVYNVRVINAGQQFLKSNPDDRGGGVDNGRVEYSVFEYTSTSRDTYTNGVDVHTGSNWIIRHNRFENLRAPTGLAGPAILMWNASSNSTVEGNTFVNCQREISLGLMERTPNDHSGGVVRNNFIYRSASVAGDAAILVADSPNTRVIHNTILVSGTYPSPIEYRFANTTGVVVANNLLDGIVQARDGASGTVTGNIGSAAAAMFAGPTTGDLHLRSTATTAIDRGTASQTLSSDWDDEARPYGSAPDVGADEYRPATTTPRAPAPPTNLRIIK
jgi:hypothetical protein